MNQALLNCSLKPMSRRSRIGRTGSLISAFFNVWWFNGNPDESISARCWREERKTAIKWIDRVFFWETDHCKNAHLIDYDHARELIYGKL